MSANLATDRFLVTVVCYGQDGAALLTELTQWDTGHAQLAAPAVAICYCYDVTARGAGVACKAGLGTSLCSGSVTQED